MNEKKYEIEHGRTVLGIELGSTRIKSVLTDLETNVLAVGIGVEGQIAHLPQTVLKSDVLSWKNVPLKEIVERRIYVPVFIDSTINGQISLRKYTQGAQCPEHFMVPRAC